MLVRETEIRYRVRSSSCGVNEIVLNGVLLPFTRRANPHRRGAVLVPKAALLAHLREHGNELAVDLG